MITILQLKKKKRTLLILAIILIVIVSFYLKNRHKVIAPAQESVIVEIEKVKKGNIAIEAHSVGSLFAANSVELTTEVAGQVAKILVEDGGYVKAGTPLIQLDDAINKVRAESAKANLTYSKANYNRILTLGKKGIFSQQAISKALTELKEKKALAEETNSLVKKMLIVAPFDGVLGKIKVNLGQYINVGQALVSITDKRHLRVEYNISEKYLRLIKKGQQVTLTTTAYPEKKFYGKLAYISPTINTEDRTISLYADVPNEDDLLTAGLFMNVKHMLGTDNNVMLLPAVSLVATIDGQQVFKIKNNKAIAVPIKIGQRTIDQVQIIEGLTLGDTIVISGQHKIKDGTNVKFKS